MALTSITLVQVDELINKAAQENRLCHYNGGQAYIQLSETTLMVIDHTLAGNIKVDLFEGTSYFQNWSSERNSVSARMRNQPSELAVLFATV